MLRVLQRSKHQGGLDKSEDKACRVVVQFGSYFRHKSLRWLREILQGAFPHVVELPVAAVGGGSQVRGWPGGRVFFVCEFGGGMVCVTRVGGSTAAEHAYSVLSVGVRACLLFGTQSFLCAAVFMIAASGGGVQARG
jgi:hypothetical protein